MRGSNDIPRSDWDYLNGGSGTTIMACEQLKRKGYYMELSPKYCDVIIKRLENLTGLKAEKVKT